MDQQNIFQLIHTLEQVSNANIVRFTKKFPYPIGISPILVLQELKVNGPKKQIELAGMLGFTKGAMTSIANKLAANDLVVRIYDETDRRTIQLDITDEGRNALKKAAEIGEQIYLDLFSALTAEEIETYLALQKKLIQHKE
ncbi:MAG: MarR family transcriptional regulator [Solibacillus sp.]|uniref:MarR family winged helix-turn-helix transcriptional regulator n=1 Tax=unclassified Solibacillus TaxID=2637870 RepID=UPI003100C105